MLTTWGQVGIALLVTLWFIGVGYVRGRCTQLERPDSVGTAARCFEIVIFIMAIVVSVAGFPVLVVTIALGFWLGVRISIRKTR